MSALEILKAAAQLDRAARHLVGQFNYFDPKSLQQANVDARQVLIHCRWLVLDERFENEASACQ